MTVAFVLSGGANLGALQVGMLRALMEREVEPDFLVGTSVGALNAGYIAGRGLRPDVVDDLGEIWRGLHTWQLFPPSPRRIVSVLRGHQAALFGDQGLRLLTKRHLTLERIEDALIPLTVVATDLLTGNEVDIRSGPAAEWDGRLLIDGGIADNTAISNAVEAGADTIYVLPSGYPCALVEPPTSITGTLLHTMTLLIHKRLVRDIREYTGAAELIVLPPPCPLEVGPLDFSRADELIDRGYEASAAFLKTDGGRRRAPADHIDLHVH